MKELPYLRFYPSEWQGGKISAFGAKEQGVYLNLCMIAWNKGGKFKIEPELLAKKLDLSIDELNTIVLQMCRFELLISDGPEFSIKWIEEQFKSSEHISKIRTNAVMTRWKKQPQKDTNVIQNDTKVIQNDTKRDDKDKDKDKDKYNTSSTPQETPKETPEPKKVKKEKIKKPEVEYDPILNSWKNISLDDLESWTAAYPACDIELQLNQMRDWLKSNPKKLKRNYRRFISNWLTRKQDKGGDIKSNPMKPTTERIEWKHDL